LNPLGLVTPPAQFPLLTEYIVFIWGAMKMIVEPSAILLFGYWIFLTSTPPHKRMTLFVGFKLKNQP